MYEAWRWCYRCQEWRRHHVDAASTCCHVCGRIAPDVHRRMT